jgi:hypothetical protein
MGGVEVARKMETQLLVSSFCSSNSGWGVIAAERTWAAAKFIHFN